MSYKLESWSVFKKRENPKIYSARDSMKGWIRETIYPTMMELGWSKTTIEDYNIEKPKEWAKKLIESSLIHLKDVDKSHFVYAFTKGADSYMDYVQVFFKKKTELC
jgi:hypothetical protein